MSTIVNKALGCYIADHYFELFNTRLQNHRKSIHKYHQEILKSTTQNGLHHSHIAACHTHHIPIPATSTNKQKQKKTYKKAYLQQKPKQFLKNTQENGLREDRGKGEDKIKSKRTRQISKRSRRDDSPEILDRVKTSDIPCRLPSGQVQETTIQSNPMQVGKI